MGVKASAWAWDQDGGSAGAKLVLMALADHANDDGVCWPGQKVIAAKAEMTPKTVRANVGRLMERGLVRQEQRKRADGSATSNLYVLAMTPPEEITHPGVADDPAPGKAATHREPSVEPSPPGSEENARARGLKVSGKPVDIDVWSRTIAALDTFNALAGKKFGALDGAGQPSEHAKRVYQRLKAWPQIAEPEVERIVGLALASRWWGTDQPTIGVVFGPKVWEQNMAREPDEQRSEKASRAAEKDARADRGLAAIQRIIDGHDRG